MTTSKQYYNFPTPRKGPDVPYYNPEKSNPVVRGWPLLIVASAYISSDTFRHRTLADMVS